MEYCTNMRAANEVYLCTLPARPGEKLHHVKVVKSIIQILLQLRRM